ncbi:hypothetical protein [Micromonospora chersina]
MLRATQAFHTTLDGVDRFVPAGELVQDDDPVVTGREGLFETAEPAAKTAPKKTTSRKA